MFAFFDGWTADAPARLAAKRASLDAAQAEARARGPQLRLVPAGPTVLELRFDRPMASAVHIVGDVPDVPDVTGSPGGTRSGASSASPVTLRAGATYRMQLNDPDAPDEGFRGQDGEVLHPRPWTITVQP